MDCCRHFQRQLCRRAASGLEHCRGASPRPGNSVDRRQPQQHGYPANQMRQQQWAIMGPGSQSGCNQCWGLNPAIRVHRVPPRCGVNRSKSPSQLRLSVAMRHNEEIEGDVETIFPFSTMKLWQLVGLDSSSASHLPHPPDPPDRVHPAPLTVSVTAERTGVVCSSPAPHPRKDQLRG